MTRCLQATLLLKYKIDIKPIAKIYINKNSLLALLVPALQQRNMLCSLLPIPPFAFTSTNLFLRHGNLVPHTVRSGCCIATGPLLGLRTPMHFPTGLE